MGPFDHWPSPGSGFEYFYGFIGGETNQWYPAIYENTSPVEPWGTPEEGYHFMADMTDKAIAWTQQQKSLAPDKPFFTYFAPGATHAPHHVPTEWADKYKGRFDQGWDALREETFARQKELGVIPADAVLTERSAGIPAWDEMSERLKPALARADGGLRGVPRVRRSPRRPAARRATRSSAILDDTLVYVIIGDNGASAEGSMHGTTNEGFTINHMNDDRGRGVHDRPQGRPRHPAARTTTTRSAGRTRWTRPYQWTKQVASALGRHRNGTIVQWPSGSVEPAASIRNQFAHVIDVAPTVLEAAGIPEPSTVNGVTQRPYEGTAMNYSLRRRRRRRAARDPVLRDAREPGDLPQGLDRRRQAQGPVARLVHGLDEDVWELYNVEEDWTQSNDLAAAEPEKLAQLQRLFLIQAARFNVLPHRHPLGRAVQPRPRRPSAARRWATSQTFYPG